MEATEYTGYRHIESKLWKLEGEWIVTEKIDGSNLAIHVSQKEEITYGSRNRALSPDDDFHGFLEIGAKYKAQIIVVLHLLQKQRPDCKGATIYAEVYGGYYKHPDVPKWQGKWVINRISYANVIDIAAFDIRPDGEAYLQFGETLSILKEAGLPTVPIVGKVTNPTEVGLHEMAEKLESVVYLSHKLPKIEKNPAEGIVIREAGGKFIYKIKRAEFDELYCRRPANHAKKGHVDPEIPATAPYVNVNVLHSAFSKLVLNEKTPLRVLMHNEAWKDIIATYFKDNPEVIGRARSKARQELHAALETLLDKEMPNFTAKGETEKPKADD